MPPRRVSFAVRYRGANIERMYVPASGIAYALEYEVTRAAIRVGVPPSQFEAWAIPDQARVIAQIRAENRIEGVLSHEAVKPARK